MNNELKVLLENYLKLLNSVISNNDQIILSNINKSLNINEDIYNFITNSIESVVYKLIILNDYTKTILLSSIIKRIGNCIEYKIINQMNVHMKLLKLFNRFISRNIRYEYKTDVIDLIMLYASDNNIDHLNKLFNIGIKYKNYGIIDKLKYFVTINNFLIKDTNSPMNSILQMKGRKLYYLLVYTE